MTTTIIELCGSVFSASAARWVLFEADTVVMVRMPAADPAEVAATILRSVDEHAFAIQSVVRLRDGLGFLVRPDHPDVYVVVRGDEIDVDTTEEAIAALARGKCAEDRALLSVRHVGG